MKAPFDRHAASAFALSALGAIAGQLAYELAFLRMGPLFVLGLAFLAGYGVIFLGGAAVAGFLRKRISRQRR
jgi:hypothetical protein